MCDTDTLTFPALFVWMLTLKKIYFPVNFSAAGVGKGWRVGALLSLILQRWLWKSELNGSYHKRNLAGWGAVLCQRSYVGHECTNVCQMTLVCDAVPRCACHELSSLFLSLALLRGKCKFPDVFWRAMEGRKWGRESKGIYYWWQQVY